VNGDILIRPGDAAALARAHALFDQAGSLFPSYGPDEGPLEFSVSCISNGPVKVRFESLCPEALEILGRADRKTPSCKSAFSELIQKDLLPDWPALLPAMRPSLLAFRPPSRAPRGGLMVRNLAADILSALIVGCFDSRQIGALEDTLLDSFDPAAPVVAPERPGLTELDALACLACCLYCNPFEPVSATAFRFRLLKRLALLPPGTLKRSLDVPESWKNGLADRGRTLPIPGRMTEALVRETEALGSDMRYKEQPLETGLGDDCRLFIRGVWVAFMSHPLLGRIAGKAVAREGGQTLLARELEALPGGIDGIVEEARRIRAARALADPGGEPDFEPLL
jgi:hypothetical protein